MPITNMKAIETVTVGAGGAASINFNSIPQTYTDLMIRLSVRSNHTAGQNDDWYMRVNGVSTGGTYSNKGVYGNGSTASSWGYTGGTSGAQIYGGWDNEATNTNIFTNIQIYFSNYANTSYNKSFCWEGVQEYNATQAYSYMGAGYYGQTTAISSIAITSWNSTWAQYTTATLYGISNTIASGAKAYGGYVTEDSTYFYHTFLSSGVFTPTQSLSVDCLVVAGGGSGGADSGGGGGAGGFRTATGLSVTATDYAVTIGAGGASPVNSGSLANNGSNSIFSSITSSGGGRGGDRGYAYPTGSAGGNGGSGGGGGGGEAPTGRTAGTGNSGSYSPSEGNNGGAGRGPAGDFSGGGGGGAGAVGTAGSGTSVGGAGGIGSYTVISGGAATGVGVLSSGNYYFAGGGGGGGNSVNGTGGIGGGGNGGLNATSGYNALANTGGGGGGAGNSTNTGRGGAGGSGVVIIRYAK